MNCSISELINHEALIFSLKFVLQRISLSLFTVYKMFWKIFTIVTASSKLWKYKSWEPVYRQIVKACISYSLYFTKVSAIFIIKIFRFL